MSTGSRDPTPDGIYIFVVNELSFRSCMMDDGCSMQHAVPNTGSLKV